jgi:hypothetical protein
VARKTSQVTAGAATTVDRTPQFGLLQLNSGEREGRDQDGHGEADASDRADAGHGRPADRWPEPAAAEAGEQPGPCSCRKIIRAGGSQCMGEADVVRDGG